MGKTKPRYTFHTYIRPIAIGLIILLIAWIVKQVSSSLSVQIYDLLPCKIWALLFLSTLGICLVLITLIVLSKSSKLKLKYAIYWDKDKNPYCPVCKSPISGYDNYPHVGRGFFCNKCDKPVPLNNNGEVIEIEQVLENI